MNENEIVVQVTAETEGLASGMKESAQSVETTMAQMQASVKSASAQMLEDIQVYNNGFTKNIKTMEQVGYAQTALARLTQQGIVTTEEAAKANAALDATQQKIIRSAEIAAERETRKAAALERTAEKAGKAAAATEALAAADALAAREAEVLARASASPLSWRAQFRQTEQAAISLSGSFRNIGNNARAMGEMSTLATEAMAGRFGQMRRSAFSLLNATGLLKMAFTGTGLAVTGVVAAVGLLAAAAVMGINNMDELNRTLISTNNATGLTADGFMELAHGLEDSETSLRNARDGLEGLAATGRFTGEQLKVAGEASRAMAEITGTSMDEANKSIVKLAEDPVRALDTLNQQFHFVTVAQMEQVIALRQAGDQYGALNLALEITNQGLARTREEWDEAKSPMRQFFDLALVKMSDMAQSIERFVDGQALVDYWHDAKSALNGYIQEYNLLAGRAGASGIMLPSIGDDKPAKKGGGEAEAKRTQEETKRVHDLAQQEKKNFDIESASLDRDRLNSEMLAHNWSIKQQQVYWQTILNSDKAGVHEKRQATQELLQLRHAEASEDGKISRQQAAEARKAAREAAQAHKLQTKDVLGDLADQRVAAAENSKEILRIDRQMVEEAAKDRAKQPQVYHQMLQQELRDKKAIAKQLREVDKETLKGAYDSAKEEREAKATAYQQEYQDGAITATRLRELQRRLILDQLRDDRVYYAARKKLEQGDVVEIAKDDAAIQKLEKKSKKDLAKVDLEYHKNVRKNWKDTAHFISQTMGSTFSQLITSGGNWRDAMNNIGRNLMERFISYEEKKFEVWLENKLTQKTTDATTDAAMTETSVAMSAMRAGAAGVASFAGAPWPVDMGAPAFGLQMAATAASFSAAGGWERVPYDGAVTELHKEEMVLPAKVANPLRDMAKSGGGGGGDHFHIHATDARSVKELMRRHPGALASGMKKAIRNGHLKGRR